MIARELVADYPDADMGQIPDASRRAAAVGTPGSIRTPAPRLGEHNEEILAEIGVDAAAYAQLLAEGVAVEPGIGG